LKFAYIPTPVSAYESVQWIVVGMPFGRLIRNLHYWGSHLLVAVAVLHMLRVFFTGAFQPPRQLNWIIGLCLLACVLLANFTGYLLPWDQLAYWAVTVSTGMLDYVPIIGGPLQAWIRDGSQLGPTTLQMFYSVHTAVVPAMLIGLMAFHFWRVRKAKGLVIPKAPEGSAQEELDRTAATTDLLLREVVVALVLFAVMLQLSVFFDAPMGHPANPGLSPNPTRAPWYFAGLQELLLYLHPVFAACLIPFLTIAALALIPYLTYPVDSQGIWFVSRVGRKSAVITALAATALGSLLIVADKGQFSSDVFRSTLSPVVTGGLIPTALFLLLIAGLVLVFRKWFAINRNEAVQSIFIFLFSIYCVLTITGVWFRGAGMQLVFPW
jgi:quinol-cytochrome oxidoreductase complex cytochrome b subunit